MENLKSEYEDVINSSEELVDTEDVLPGDANFDKSIEKEINAYEDIFKDEGIGGLRRALCENSNKWKNIGLHIAVTGSSGAGKSSFINAIRDVTAEDEGGAEVGVTETTAELTPFKHPKNPNFIVWDMPGVGTLNFPKENYLKDVKFDRYDFFMILYNNRFSENDWWLAKEIQQQGKRFYFIRTKIDEDIRSNKRSHPKSHSARGVIETVRQECNIIFEDAGFEKPHVFLVDNFDRLMFDFGQLELQLVQDSDSLKKEAMALSLTVLTRDILQEKKQVLEKRIDDKAMEIACLVGDDTKRREMFDEEMSIYMEQFCLDEKTLGVNKDILSLSEDNLKQFQSFFRKISITTFRRPLRLRYNNVYRKLVHLIKILKGIPSTLYSESVLQFTCLALHNNLEKVHKNALKVYNLDAQKGLVESVWTHTTS